MRVYEGMFKKSSGIREILSQETIFEAPAADNALRVTLIRPPGIMSHKLNGDAFHTEVTSPHPHVIRVRSSHLLGKQRRYFGFPNIPGNSVLMDTGETGEGLWCRSGALSLHMEDQAVRIRQEDAGTQSVLSYKNLPFYITRSPLGKNDTLALP